LNILLAEDNPINQEVAAGLLESLDCIVTIVENGQEAVEATGDRAFDLVLMDCQMPVMDGFEATSTIRKMLSGGERLPIIALTANDLEDAKTACLAAGMDDFLSKPFTRQELQALLTRWQPSALPSPRAEPEPKAAPAFAAETEASSLDLAPIDTLRALDPNGERNIVQRAVTKFADYSDELLARLANAIGEGNIEEVSRLAHSLKSSSANLGATDLSRQCTELEKLTGTGGLPCDIGQRLTTMQATQQAAKQALFQLVDAG